MSCNAGPMSGGRHRRGHRGGKEKPVIEEPKPLGPKPLGPPMPEPSVLNTPEGGRHRRRSRRMRGGMGYGFGGTIGTAGPVWNSSWGGEITKSGQPIYDTADRPPVTGGRRRKSHRGGVDEVPEDKRPLIPETPKPDVVEPKKDGGRRRKSRKASKKTKKSRRRTMRGGMSVAHASAGFAGTGSRGLADYKDVGGSQPFSNDVVPLK